MNAKLPRQRIFVFGSNLAGIHGAGAARVAEQRHGALWGKGVGLHGNSYALPTKDRQIQTLPLYVIEQHVQTFIDCADTNPDKDFIVTRVGCGLAGYGNEDIAPLFFHAPSNCQFDLKWKYKLGEKFKYWGTV